MFVPYIPRNCHRCWHRAQWRERIVNDWLTDWSKVSELIQPCSQLTSWLAIVHDASLPMTTMNTVFHRCYTLKAEKTVPPLYNIQIHWKCASLCSSVLLRVLTFSFYSLALAVSFSLALILSLSPFLYLHVFYLAMYFPRWPVIEKESPRRIIPLDKRVTHSITLHG